MAVEKINLDLENTSSGSSADKGADVVDNAALESASVLGESVDLNSKVSEKGKKKPLNDLVVKSRRSSTAKPAKVSLPVMPSTTKEQKVEIRAVIESEIKVLRKKISTMQNSKNFYEMSSSVARMRTLKSVLKSLLRASVDSVKELWVKFVGGKNKKT